MSDPMISPMISPMSDLRVRGGSCDVDVTTGLVATSSTGRVLDAAGLTVLPGVIDLQVNGVAGIDITAEPTRLWEAGAALASYGITAWVPTVITSAPRGPDDLPGAQGRAPRALAATSFRGAGRRLVEGRGSPDGDHRTRAARRDRRHRGAGLPRRGRLAGAHRRRHSRRARRGGRGGAVRDPPRQRDAVDGGSRAGTRRGRARWHRPGGRGHRRRPPPPPVCRRRDVGGARTGAVPLGLRHHGGARPARRSRPTGRPGRRRRRGRRPPA